MKTRIHSILIMCLFVSVSGFYGCNKGYTDPFEEFKDVMPAVFEKISEEKPDSGNPEIITKRFTFISRNGMDTVFAVLSFPEAEGVYPALVTLHGGGSNAEARAPRAESFAKKGYVAVSIDQPGICGTENTPYTRGAWKNAGAGEAPRLQVEGGPQNSTLVSGITAIISMVNYLASLPNVDTGRIGLDGTSWGGYSSTLVAGLLGEKIKAVFSVYGCGFYDKGTYWTSYLEELPPENREIWLKYLDAGRRTSGMSAAYFNVAATNDTYFWPPALEATLETIPCYSGRLYGANNNHTEPENTSVIREHFFDYWLKGEGYGFPSASLTDIQDLPDGKKEISFSMEFEPDYPIEKIEYWYSTTDRNYQEREWIKEDVILSGKNECKVILGKEVFNNEIDYFLTVTDRNNVSVSSTMYSLINN